MFLLYPDYMAVLVVYFCVCLGTVLVLGVQGPYPGIPNWLYQASYVPSVVCPPPLTVTQGPESRTHRIEVKCVYS